MSHQPPGDVFVPPPPPSTGNPMYPENVLAAKAAEAASEAKNALIMSLVGLVCFGFIFGFLAFRKASAALETIDHYQVKLDKRGLAKTAKILGIVDIIGWIVALVARFAFA